MFEDFENNIRYKIDIGADRTLSFSAPFHEDIRDVGELFIELGNMLSADHVPMDVCPKCEDFIWGKASEHECITQLSEDVVLDKILEMIKDEN